MSSYLIYFANRYQMPQNKSLKQKCKMSACVYIASISLYHTAIDAQ